MNDRNDESEREDRSYSDSGELLNSLFREEMDGLTAHGKGKLAPKKDRNTTAVKKPKSPSQVKDASRKNAGVQMAAEKRKIVKMYPVSEAQVDTPEKVASKRDTLLKKAVEAKTAPRLKDDKREGARAEEAVKIKETKGGKRGFGGKLGQSPGRRRIALLSVILVAAVAFLLNSLGIVDFGKLLGFSEPAKKATRLAAESTQKTSGRVASNKTTSQKRKPIVKTPYKDTVSKNRPRIIKRLAKSITSTQESIVDQKLPEPTTPTQEPVVAKQLPKPIASTGKKPVVPLQPPKPTSNTQKLPMTEVPPQSTGFTQKPVVAKKTLEPSAAKVQPVVVKAPPKSADQTRKKAGLGKEELLPGESDLSYPYSVYLGSFKTLEQAERAISGYRKKGLSPYWVKADLGDKGVWFRVFSGYFQKREQADEFIENKQVVGAESRHTRYANLIGIFASEKELDEKKFRLSQLGCCPYIVPGPNGESLLYVGAFYQKARAQIQHTELASKGIQSQVVER